MITKMFLNKCYDFRQQKINCYFIVSAGGAKAILLRNSSECHMGKSVGFVDFINNQYLFINI